MAVAFNLMEERIIEYRGRYLSDIEKSLKLFQGTRLEKEQIWSDLENYVIEFGKDCPKAREIVCNAFEEHLYDDESGLFIFLSQIYTENFPLGLDESSRRFGAIRSSRADWLAEYTRAHTELYKKSGRKLEKFIKETESQIKKEGPLEIGSSDYVRYRVAKELLIIKSEDPYARWFKTVGKESYFDYDPENDEVLNQEMKKTLEAIKPSNTDKREY